MTEKSRVRDTLGMIIQFPVTEDEPHCREREEECGIVAMVLEALFYHAGLGKVDGTDQGSGSINIYIFDIPDPKWDQAVDLAKKELLRRNLLDKVRIAKSVSWETQTDEWVDYEVVWPVGYPDKFSVF